MAKAGGVQLQAIDPPRDETELFTCSSSRFASETSSVIGFGDIDQTTGGYLNGVVICNAA